MPPRNHDDKRNPERRNGKARKKNPGVSESSFTGRTVGGYSPAKQQQRAITRGGAN